MYIGMRFDCRGSLHTPVPVLIVFLAVWFELRDKFLDVILVLGGQ